MAIADFLRTNQKARTIDSADEKKSNSVAPEVDIDKENEALQNKPKKSVTENLSNEQLNQVDEIAQKLKGFNLEQKNTIQDKLNSQNEVLNNENLSSKVPQQNEIESKVNDDDKSKKQNNVKIEQQKLDYNRDDSVLQPTQKSISQLDEKSVRKEIQDELRTFNIADFRINENGSLIDPAKYYKFLALRERAGGLGMETEFNKMEAAIENIKYQELEKYSRKFIGEKSIIELQNKTTSSELDYRETSFNEDLKQLMVSFKNFRDSLTNAIACGVIEAVKLFTNQGEIEQYILKDIDSAESKDFLNNLGKVLNNLQKIGLKTNIGKDQETGKQYIEVDLPANYKGRTDITKLDLQDIEKSIRDSLSPTKSKNESENTEKKAPKLRILVNSILAIQKLKKAQEKNGENYDNLSENTEQEQDKRSFELDLRGGDFSKIKESFNIFDQMNKRHSNFEESNKDQITNSSEAADKIGKFAKMILEKRRESKERGGSNQIGG